MDRREENRAKALKDLQQSEVLMIDGHFDYGNGYHGRVYLNPHQLFRHPSTIWRFAQDLIDVLPADVVQATEVVAGPVTGGALLAHTIAGLLDSRRSLTHPPCSLRAVQLRSGRRLHAARVLRARAGRQACAAGRRRAEYGRDVRALRGAGEGGRRHGAGDGRNLRSPRSHRRTGVRTSRWPNTRRQRTSRRRRVRSAPRTCRLRDSEDSRAYRSRSTKALAAVFVIFVSVKRVCRPIVERAAGVRSRLARSRSRSIRIFLYRPALQSGRASS